MPRQRKRLPQGPAGPPCCPSPITLAVSGCWSGPRRWGWRGCTWTRLSRLACWSLRSWNPLSAVEGRPRTGVEGAPRWPGVGGSPLRGQAPGVGVAESLVQGLGESLRIPVPPSAWRDSAAAVTLSVLLLCPECRPLALPSLPAAQSHPVTAPGVCLGQKTGTAWLCFADTGHWLEARTAAERQSLRSDKEGVFGLCVCSTCFAPYKKQNFKLAAFSCDSVFNCLELAPDLHRT